jgi:hypothetical protein
LATRPTDRPPGTRRQRSAIPAAPILPTPGGAGAALDPRLIAELATGPWEQSWELTPSIHTAAAEAGARQRAWTLGEMIRPAAFDAFAVSDRRRALDLRCGEGWLAQQLLGWGARSVVAVDDRPDALRRARLLREHFAIPEAALRLVDRADWQPPAGDDRFDVVLLTGAPDGAGDEAALADAHRATRLICAIECHGAETNDVAEAALAAGFNSVERLRPPLQGAPTYVVQDRDVLIAKAAIGS